MTSSDDGYRQALRWLAARPLTRVEVVRRLERRGYPDPAGVAARLEREGWLSDTDVVERELARAAARREGRGRLKARLVDRGVPAELQAEALGRWDPEAEWAAACEWARRDPPVDAKSRARLARRLARRGFAASTIARLLERWADPGDGPEAGG